MSNKIHIAVDLETIGVNTSAPLISLGVVLFTLGDDPKILDEQFYQVIDIDDAIKHGEVEGGSLKWWITNPHIDAKNALFGSTEVMTTKDTLLALNEFIHKHADNRSPMIWGNGALFDVGILEDKYKKLGVEIPWHFSDISDLRTIEYLAKSKEDYDHTKMFENEIPHHALHDAIAQANEVIHYYKFLI